MTTDRTLFQQTPQRSEILAQFLAQQKPIQATTPLEGISQVGQQLVEAFALRKQQEGLEARQTSQSEELARAFAGTTSEGPLPSTGIGPGEAVTTPATSESIIQALAGSKDPALQQLGLTQKLSALGRQEDTRGQIATEDRAEQTQIRKEKRAGGAGFTLTPGQVRFDAQGNEIASAATKPPTAPAGFREVTTPEGQALEAIPGGPAAIAAEKAARAQEGVAKKLKLNREGQQLKATNSIKAATRALAFLEEKKKFIDPTGLAGQITQFIGGTDANQLNKLIEPIRANLGFDELQKMREASPTGGALGQVAVRELELLQATLVNLDISQKTEFLEQALNDVNTHFNNWLSAVNQAEEEGNVGDLSDEELRAIVGGQ